MGRFTKYMRRIVFNKKSGKSPAKQGRDMSCQTTFKVDYGFLESTRMSESEHFGRPRRLVDLTMVSDVKSEKGVKVTSRRRGHITDTTVSGTQTSTDWAEETYSLREYDPSKTYTKYYIEQSEEPGRSTTGAESSELSDSFGAMFARADGRGDSRRTMTKSGHYNSRNDSNRTLTKSGHYNSRNDSSYDASRTLTKSGKYDSRNDSRYDSCYDSRRILTKSGHYDSRNDASYDASRTLTKSGQYDSRKDSRSRTMTKSGRDSVTNFEALFPSWQDLFWNTLGMSHNATYPVQTLSIDFCETD